MPSFHAEAGRTGFDWCCTAMHNLSALSRFWDCSRYTHAAVDACQRCNDASYSAPEIWADDVIVQNQQALCGCLEKSNCARISRVKSASTLMHEACTRLLTIAALGADKPAARRTTLKACCW